MKSLNSIKVLIPDGESFFALSVINCLSDLKDIEIHIIYSSNEVNGVQYSNKIDSFARYNKTNDDIDFVNFIKNKLVTRKIDVLMPLHIDSIGLLSTYRGFFNELNYKILVTNTEVFNSVCDKWELSKYLVKNQIYFPKTISNFKFLSDLNFPILYKPAKGTAGGLGIKLLKSFNDVTKELINSDNYILQEYIKGYDADCNVLCLNGKILAYTMQKSIMSSSKPFGPPDAVEFFYDPKLHKMMERLFKSLNWTGVANVDLLYDERDSSYKLIEINSRFWGSIEASHSVGVNFPYLYCLTALGIQYEIPNYHFEKYANNRALIKILKSKIGFKRNRLKVPNNLAIRNDLLDPLPKIIKYCYKVLNKTRLVKKFIVKFSFID